MQFGESLFQKLINFNWIKLIDILINSSALSPNVTNSKSSPTDSLKKVSNTSNGRTILPKTITTQSSHTDKRMPPNASYSSQKCQNDAKQHPSYSSVFHSKPISNPKPTSMPQQTVQSRQINGSYARLTNKLNCCKGCVRDGDDAVAKKCTNEMSIPKLKNDTKYSSQFIDPSANWCYEQEQHKYTMPSDAKRSTIPGAFRRNSINANAILRKPTFKRSLDEDLLNAGDFRRQSFDDCTSEVVTNQRHLKKLTPPQSEHQSDFQRNGHGNGNGNSNGNGNYLSQSVGKHIPSNDNRRLIKQKSLDEYADATARLRKLEMKMRKHKIDVLKYANEHDQSNIYNEKKKLLAYPASNQFRTKIDPFARTKAACVYPKIGIDSVIHSKSPAYRNKNVPNANYGIITSSELYKIRGTPERVT